MTYIYSVKMVHKMYSLAQDFATGLNLLFYDVKMCSKNAKLINNILK
jgi:hypothetical protein